VSPPATPPATREVLISVTPADTTIERDGASLGQSPVAIHLAEGEQATLVLARKGYKTKTVSVNGGEPKVSFALESLAPSPPRPAAASPKAGPAAGGIDDVGDPFAKHR
jgi:hypothetical protein